MFGIRKLDIFIAKQFGLLFIGTFFICQFVLMMQFLWRWVDELIGKGLSMDVLAQFFWYMGLFLIPQALPLAILLSSLITFGNLGESCELTAIKAAGISLMQAFRPLIVIVLIICGVSFYFQNVIGPHANKQFGQLLLSMKQKSPELEIPEGIFYDGIPNCNIYVQKKNMETGKLYGVMIYRMTGSYDDAAIILADSGMLQSTAEKKHLKLNLYSGEWFENMKSQDVSGAANIPYRRETFGFKTIILDFDGDFNMADGSGISADAKSKSITQIYHDLDSIREFNDSVGHTYKAQSRLYSTFYTQAITKEDTAKALAEAKKINIDSILAKMGRAKYRDIIRTASNEIQSEKSDLEMKGDYTKYLNRRERTHRMEAINKITLSISCLIFFFIGAPLGAIIRKGGLGVPVIISVLVFIIYFIFENTGMKMARDNEWSVEFGKFISTAVLAPVAVFFTYKANGDSTVFNIDMYKEIICRLLGLRTKRLILKKDVVINDPDYDHDQLELQCISQRIEEYSCEHHLLRAPNPIKVFFREGDDRVIREVYDQLETVIEDLSNTKDRYIVAELNHYPVIATHAHTRPFRNKWLNMTVGLLLPLGLFFYLRMWRFRLRLYKDLKQVVSTNDTIIKLIDNNKSKASNEADLA